jgi:hypothetical protein
VREAAEHLSEAWRRCSLNWRYSDEIGCERIRRQVKPYQRFEGGATKVDSERGLVFTVDRQEIVETARFLSA